MRKFVTIGMTLTGAWTVMTGLLLDIVNIGNHAHHVFPAYLFLVFMVWHLVLNWKPFLCRFKALGWKWALVGLAVVFILAFSFAHQQ